MSLRIDVLEIALNSLDDTDYPLDNKVEEVLQIINGNSNARLELVNELASEAGKAIEEITFCSFILICIC